MGREEEQCECRAAVLRAFGELRRRKMSEKAAFDSATVIFNFHHPEIPEAEAKNTVSEWIAG